MHVPPSAFSLLAVSLLFAPLSRAAVIAIQNGDFETNAATLVPNDGDFTFGPGGVPEWDDHFPLSNASGIFNPDTFSATSGSAVLFLDGGGYVVQDLEFADASAVLAEPLSVITISGQINNRFASGAVRLGVSIRDLPNTNVVPQIVFDPVDADGWNPFSVTFTLPDAATLGAHTNQPLFLVFDGISGQVNLDDISASVVPEPSAALLAAGIAAMGLMRRRRSL